jgi:pyrrolysyl-tRNA synthetase-like protein
MTSEKKRYYRKHVELYPLINKMKLWPSRKGILHGVKEVGLRGDFIEITTHCNEFFRVYNSKTSRAARWIRNKWAGESCKVCKVPQWKLDKYSKTFFSQHYGTELIDINPALNGNNPKELGE